MIRYPADPGSFDEYLPIAELMTASLNLINTSDPSFIQQNKKYYYRYREDTHIVFEIIGNRERNSIGSSLFNTYAEYWGYGFFVSGQIVKTMIFDRKRLADFLQKNAQTYRKIVSDIDNGKYHTESILVPLGNIDGFTIPKAQKIAI